jgi:hypothetical protein
MLVGASPSAAARLGGYPVDPAQLSVSGIASSAFIANQLHFIHCADIMSAAVIAGARYGCVRRRIRQITGWRRSPPRLADPQVSAIWSMAPIEGC